MKIYFDTEFTGLHKETTLISIGLVAETGESFYAEFTDYDKDQLNDWLIENIIENLSKDEEDLKTYADITIKGDSSVIQHALMNWLGKFKLEKFKLEKDEQIDFVSDVCHYDFVLLIDLIAKNALQMPTNISPVCYDINYDIASYYDISESEAFDKSREDLLEDYDIIIQGKKHNAVYDTKVIATIDYMISN